MKVSIPTIKRYVSEEKISSIKFNGIRRITCLEILSILNNQFASPRLVETSETKDIGQHINKIICGDAAEVISNFPSNSVDIVITSPPYDNVRDYKGFSLDLHAIGKELYRVLKDGGIVAMVIQDQTKNFGKSLTSFKTMTGGGTRLTNGVRIATRSITINPTKCRGTIWDYLTAGDGSRLKHQHTATFPNRLPYDFIQCFCPKKGIVLDLFVGSGTSVVAAKNLGCEYIGIDIASEYCAIAEKRIEGECKIENMLLRGNISHLDNPTNRRL